MYIYINGKFYKEKDAKVSVLDRGFLYGDGVFETMRVYNGKIFTLKEHLKRLRNSAGKILLDLGVSDEEIEKVLYKTLEKNKLKDAVLRLSFSRGIGPFGLSVLHCNTPTFVAGARRFNPYPSAFYKEGVNVIISKKVTAYSESYLRDVKSLNYLPNIVAKSEINSWSKEHRAKSIENKLTPFEVLLLNEDGFVTEGTVSNFFVVKNGILITPPLSAGVLPGITRLIVLRLAKKLKIKTQEKLFRPDLIYSSQETFLTNISIEILPVTKINGKIINSGKPGERTLKLRGNFRKLILERRSNGKD